MPTKEWLEIRNGEDEQKVIGGFVYPMIGICTFFIFLGTLIRNNFEVIVLQQILSNCCEVAISLFAGFFLASYLVSLINRSYLKQRLSIYKIRQLVGYSMVVIFLLKIIGVIFPFPLLLGFCEMYIIFVVFEGARILLNIERAKITYYTLMTSFVIVVCPLLVDWIFNKLSLNLN